MKIRYEAHDVFAADIYFHNSSYIKFALTKIEKTVDETVELLENDILGKIFLRERKESYIRKMHFC